MPTYEYRCANGHDFEAFQRMSEDALDTCPDCGAAAERQLSAGAGLLFKGNGFYITDYRSASYKKAAEADARSSGEGSSAKKEGGSSGKDGSGSSASGSSASGSGGAASGKGPGGAPSKGSSD